RIAQSIARSGTTPVTTSYTYGVFGHLLRVTDPASNLVSTAYDVLGRRISLFDRDRTTVGVLTTSYGFDASWNDQIKTTDSSGQTTTAIFDRVGRPVSRSAPDPDFDGTPRVAYDCFRYNDAPGVARGTLGAELRRTDGRDCAQPDPADARQLVKTTF